MEQRKRGKKSQEERCGCFQTCTHASRTHWHASAKRAAQTEHYWKLCVGERLEKELMVAQFTIEPLIFPCNLLRLLLRLIHNLKFIPPLSLWHTLIVTLLSRFPTSYSCNTASHHQPLSLSLSLVTLCLSHLFLPLILQSHFIIFPLSPIASWCTSALQHLPYPPINLFITHPITFDSRSVYL